MKKIFLTLFSLFLVTSFNVFASGENQKKVLVVYFSVPEDARTNGVDGVVSASVQFLNGERVGSTEKLAKLIQKRVQGDIFRIETEKPYPTEHDALTDYANGERNRNERPTLKNHIENLGDYDTIFLGYPIWWYGFPMPLLSFLYV